MRGGLCHHPRGVQEKFPRDQDLVDLGIESYLGVPLLDGDGQVLGPPGGVRRAAHAAPSRAGCSSSGSSPPVRPSSSSGCGSSSSWSRASGATGTSTRRRRTPTWPSAADRRLLSVNRRATQLLGYPAAELVGSTILELLRRHAGRPAAGRGGAPGGLRRRGGLRPGAGDAPAGRRARSGSASGCGRCAAPTGGSRPSIRSGSTSPTACSPRPSAPGSSEQNLYLQEELKSVHNFEEIVGRSPALLAVLDKVRRVAPTDATVLINGETGTGKELIARAIHSNSRRAAKPLIKVNCAALPAGLVESELFGHEKGAFTGAIARRIGRFELADGGTLFLDEIGELPAGDPGQAAPRPPGARVRPRRRRRRRSRSTSGSSPPPTATCSRPSARRRSARTSTTASASSRSSSRRSASAPRTSRSWRSSSSTSSPRGSASASRASSRETMRRLTAYRWPGNIRELENVLERAVILATGRPSTSRSTATSSASPSREPTARRPLLPGRRRAEPYPRGPRADQLGHRRAARRGRDPRPPPQHPPQPPQEARPLAVVPRTLVVGHDISWRPTLALRRSADSSLVRPKNHTRLPHSDLRAMRSRFVRAVGIGDRLSSLEAFAGAAMLRITRSRGERLDPHAQARRQAPRALGRRAESRLRRAASLAERPPP